MKKNVLISIFVVIAVLSVLGTACFCAYVTNRDTVNASVDNLLETRIEEYINANSSKFTGPTGSTGARGEKGEAGENGADGQTPYIGENGNWWIGDTDTGYSIVSGGGSSANKYYSDMQIGYTGETFAFCANFNYIGEKQGTEITKGDVYEYLISQTAFKKAIPAKYHDFDYINGLDEYQVGYYMTPATGYFRRDAASEKGTVVGISVVECSAYSSSVVYDFCIFYVNSAGEIKCYCVHNYSSSLQCRNSEVL